MGLEIDYKSCPRAGDWNFLIGLLNGSYCQASRQESGTFAPPTMRPFVYGASANKRYFDNAKYKPILDENGSFIRWEADVNSPVTDYMASYGYGRNDVNSYYNPDFLASVRSWGIREFDGYGKINYGNLMGGDYLLHSTPYQAEPHGYSSWPPNECVGGEGYFNEFPYTTVTPGGGGGVGVSGWAIAKMTPWHGNVGYFNFNSGNVLEYPQILGRIPDGAQVRHAWAQVDIQSLQYVTSEIRFEEQNGKSVECYSHTTIDTKRPTGMTVFAAYSKDDPTLTTSVEIYDFSPIGAVSSQNSEYIATHYELLGEQTYEITTLLIDIGPLCEGIRNAAKSPRFCGLFISPSEGDFVMTSVPSGRGAMKGMLEGILGSVIEEKYTYYDVEFQRDITTLKYQKTWGISYGGCIINKIIFDILYPDTVLDEVPINANQWPMF